ncbi:MAG: glycosyltransferase family 2 protein [Planctomycetes bacterium]|nr:glycosyltransferase family 2 protein [Planctomycetota bacterium]
MTAIPLLSIVVPVYNEEQTLPKFLTAMRAALTGVTEDYEIIFCADPCRDRTLTLVGEAHAADPRIKLLAFSRRFGQPAATMGGIHHAAGRAVVIIDCDLQDPPALIGEMVRQWRSGWKVVVPQRRSRDGEHPLKKLISYLGYWFINKISNVRIPRNTGDFRLMDRAVVDELKKLKEGHGFLRGLVAVVGFKTVLLPFDREARAGGVGKYNRITGSLRIGFNGIICFSDYLLNFMIKMGLACAALAMLSALVIAYMKLGTNWQFASGVPSLMILVLFMGGMQLIGMGVLGAYIGRIYDETKQRPLFIVEEALGFPQHPPLAPAARSPEAACAT